MPARACSRASSARRPSASAALIFRRMGGGRMRISRTRIAQCLPPAGADPAVRASRASSDIARLRAAICSSISSATTSGLHVRGSRRVEHVPARLAARLRPAFHRARLVHLPASRQSADSTALMTCLWDSATSLPNQNAFSGELAVPVPVASAGTGNPSSQRSRAASASSSVDRTHDIRQEFDFTSFGGAAGDGQDGDR